MLVFSPSCPGLWELQDPVPTEGTGDLLFFFFFVYRLGTEPWCLLCQPEAFALPKLSVSQWTLDLSPGTSQLLPC